MDKTISEQEITSFVETVWRFYRNNGRNDLAWRKSTDPYSIVLSEIMLQQTQVARVEEYFKRWKKTFPDWKTLSQAHLSEVLTQWQGLGYNRRGKYLHDISKDVVEVYGGVFPTSSNEIRALPGIGIYTEAAVQAFAFNYRSVLIETNTRTAVIFHFFKNNAMVTDAQIKEVLERCYKKGTKAYKLPREWNWALMDYGSYLKKEVGNLNKKSSTYAKQSRFEGSRRQLRSRILKFILEKEKTTLLEIFESSLQKDIQVIKKLLMELEREGMVKQKGNTWFIA